MNLDISSAPVLIGALSGLGASLLTFLGIRLLHRGSVSSSTADELWTEQREFRRSMRREMERRLAECRDELLYFQRQNLELRVSNHELVADNMRIRFLTHPEIPQDMKDEFVKHQRDHVVRLKAALLDLDTKEAEQARLVAELGDEEGEDG